MSVPVMKTFIKKNLKAGFMFLIFLPGFFPAIVSAQENVSEVIQNKESGPGEGNRSKHSLYCGLGFGNNMIYMGSNVSQGKPFYSGSLTYGYNNAFFASASVSHLSAFDEIAAFSAFSVGYSHDFNSWFDISLGLSRYQVNSELTDTLFSSFLYSYLTLGFDWKILYTTVSAGGLFSGSNSAYMSLKNSRFIKTPDLMNGKAYFYFDPYVNMLLGTLTKTVTSEGTTIGVTAPFSPKKTSDTGGKGSGTTSSTTTFFSLMDVDLGLPVGFNIGKINIEAEPGYALPAYSDSDFQSPKGFTFLINIIYRIF